MKKLITVAAAACALALTALFTGCEPNESTLIAAANTAGNLGLSAWFAIDDPDATVKESLRDVVTLVSNGASSVGGGGTYIDALTPAIQKFVAENDKLNPAQKNLINTGASVILSALDTFIDSKPELKGDAALVSKVVAAFCKGCLTAIERSEDCCSARSLKRAHQVIRMKYAVSAKAFVE
jgi:hypothetical protein